MVGGGAGGVEISLALNHRLKEERSAAGQAGAADCSVSLFTSSHILTGHTPAARRKFLRIAQVCPCSLPSAPASCNLPLLLAIWPCSLQSAPAPCNLPLPLLLAIYPCSLQSGPAPCNLPLLLAICPCPCSLQSTLDPCNLPLLLASCLFCLVFLSVSAPAAVFLLCCCCLM